MDYQPGPGSPNPWPQDPAATAGVAPAGAAPAVSAPEGRKPWWAPAPDPVLPRITAGRAYTEVLLVFAAFFLVGIIGAVQLLSSRYSNPLATASWGLYLPEAVDLIIQIGLALAVVLLLSARRGVRPRDLGLTIPRNADGRFAAGRVTRIAAWAMFALVLGGVFNAILQTGHLPTTKATVPELIFAVGDSIQAGVIEELVVLAFVVVTLRQAGRPYWEVTLVALALRGSYHIYYGPGVVGILIWAALYYWIYLRTRGLVVLMVCHAAWDAVGFLSERWAFVAVIGTLMLVALWIAAPITWLVERSHAERQLMWAGQGPGPGWWTPPDGGSPGRWPQAPWPPSHTPWPPAGWQPDPSGVHHWRWWDGRRWTDHVSGP